MLTLKFGRAGSQMLADVSGLLILSVEHGGVAEAAAEWRISLITPQAASQILAGIPGELRIIIEPFRNQHSSTRSRLQSAPVTAASRGPVLCLDMIF